MLLLTKSIVSRFISGQKHIAKGCDVHSYSYVFNFHKKLPANMWPRTEANMNFCQHSGRWIKKYESSAHDPNMSSGASMAADFSVGTQNQSNWVFGFLLTLPEKPLSSMEYDTHDNRL